MILREQTISALGNLDPDRACRAVDGGVEDLLFRVSRRIDHLRLPVRVMGEHARRGREARSVADTARWEEAGCTSAL